MTLHLEGVDLIDRTPSRQRSSMAQQRLRDQFIKAASELAQDSRAGIVRLDDVTNHVDLDPSDPNYVNKLDNIALYWGQRGYIDKVADGYGLFSVTAKGTDYAEGREAAQQPPSVSTTINISGGTFQGSVLGANNRTDLVNNFDLRSIEIEQQIEDQGGEDKEELRAALAEMRRIIESEDSIERGRLAQFSGVMERHSWFTNAIAASIAEFVTQAIGG